MRDQLGKLIDVVVALIDAFEQSGFDYALGGAVAYSTWAIPRATQDIDLNVWVDPENIDPILRLFGAISVELDEAVARREAVERGMFIGWKDGYRIDVFVPSVPFYEEARERRRRVRIAGRGTWVLSPETLAVFKLLFFRPKDLLDVRRMVEVQGEAFDGSFVRSSLVDMLGEEDGRIREWDAIVEDGVG